jgi:hypothetical protein
MRSYYRRLFIIGGWWNLGGTAFIWIAAQFFGFIEHTLHMEPVRYRIFFEGWLGLAFVFGIGYLLVAVDLHRNRDIALLGVIGKLLFSFIFITRFIEGLVRPELHPRVHPFFLIPVAGDLIFVALYVRFLAWERAQRRKAGYEECARS